MMTAVVVWQWVKPKKIDFEPRHRKKGRSRAGKREQRRQGVIAERKQTDIKHSVQHRLKLKQQQLHVGKHAAAASVLDRFNKKTN